MWQDCSKEVGSLPSLRLLGDLKSPSVADFDHPRLALLRIIEPRGGRIVINGNLAKETANDSSLWIKSLHVIVID